MKLKETIANANSRLGLLLAETKQALRGEREFGPEQVSALREPLTQMDPVMAKSKELRLLRPELEGELELYKAQLGDLRETLEKVRLMLLARQVNLCSSHAQLTAVSQWARRLDQTR
jgi:hypothetical protein